MVTAPPNPTGRSGARSICRSLPSGQTGTEMLSAALISAGVVAIAEIGDKTQLLAMVLAARFRRRPLTIIVGILTATLANHAAAALVGATLSGFLQGPW